MRPGVKVITGLAAVIVLLLNNQVASQDTLNINVDTPQPAADGTITTLSGEIATSLLAGAKGWFYGAVPGSDVNAACQSLVNTGSYDIPATVTAYGQTTSTTLHVQAVGGCLAGPDSPNGVQAVLADDSGRKYAVVCSQSSSCAVYVAASSRRRELRDTASDVGCVGGVVAAGATLITACAAATFGLCGLAAAGFVGGTAAACQQQVANAVGGCFPGHASAALCGGGWASMDRLRLGDVLLVRRADGGLGCDPIYAWGHQEAHTTSNFVRLALVHHVADAVGGATAGNTTVTLELSPGHFLVVQGPNRRPTHKRARDAAVGDIMWLLPPGASDGIATGGTSGPLPVLASIVGVSASKAAGRFAPYTLGGTLVVEGVVVSAHSEWFADPTFDALGAPPAWLPPLYQAALAPVRLGWWALGQEAYVDLYTRLDAELDFASLCSAGAGGWAGLLGTTHAMGRALLGAAVVLAGRVAAAVAWTALALPAAVAMAVFAYRGSSKKAHTA